MNLLRGFASYDPPYESPIEDDLALGLAKYVELGTAVEKQVEVQTICGNFRLDFVATAPGGRRIAYECDGKEFHSGEAEVRDEWRDAMILGAGAVDGIVRVPGSAIFYHLEDLFLLLANWDRDIFSERARWNLNRLGSDRAIAFMEEHELEDSNDAMITYWEAAKTRHNPPFSCLWRRNRRVAPGRREFWQALFRFASWVGGGNLEDVFARRGELFVTDGAVSSDVCHDVIESGMTWAHWAAASAGFRVSFARRRWG
jgi:hypothetical protein